MLQNAIIGAGLVVVGIVVALVGARQLGLSRAAGKWDSSDGPPRIGRGLATTVSLIGLLLVAAGAAVLALQATLVQLPSASQAVRFGVVAAVAIVALLVFMFIAAKVADRAELNALIRTPSRIRRLPGDQSAAVGADPAGHDASDSVVPPTARPGWVYRDPGGAWYLVVSAGAGYRLVSLPDFKLVSPGMVKPPISAAGSVELAVWPLSESPGVRQGETQQAAT